MERKPKNEPTGIRKANFSKLVIRKEYDKYHIEVYDRERKRVFEYKVEVVEVLR